MIEYLRLIVNFTVILAITLVLAPVQWLAGLLKLPLAKKIPLFWHKMLLWMIGSRIQIRGEIPTSRPLLIVSNHLSWSDIIVLGSAMELCFIAKSDVKSWPGFNLLALLQRTVFVERERRAKTGIQADSIASRLLEGDAMVLFAEGTTNDGHTVYPFKSALFGAAERARNAAEMNSIRIQPTAIAYTHQHGIRHGRYHRGQIAWPGDVPLRRHFLEFFLKGAHDIVVNFGEPVHYDGAIRRQELARLCHKRVSELYWSAMAD